MTTSVLPNQPETPSEALARQIVERLVAAQLIRADDAATLQAKLADGTVKAEDWRLWVELSGEQRGEQ